MVQRTLEHRFGDLADDAAPFGDPLCLSAAGEAVAADDDARDRFSSDTIDLATVKLSRELWHEAVGLTGELLPLDLANPEAEAAWADEAFAQLLERIEPEGKDAATARKASRLRRERLEDERKQEPVPGTESPTKPGLLWDLWYRLEPMTVLRWLKPLAKLLWRIRIKPALRVTAAATPLPEAREIMRRAGVLDVRDDQSGQLSLLYRSESAEVDLGSRLVMDAAALRQAAMRFRSPDGNRTVKYLVRSCWERYERDEPNHSDFYFPSAAAFAAAVLGDAADKVSRKRAASFVDIAQMLTVLVYDPARRMSWDLASCVISHGGKGRATRIWLSLNPVLRPGGLYEFKRSRPDKRLVPVTNEPPLVGRANERGAVLWFWEHLVIAISEQSRDVRQGRGAAISDANIKQAADASLLPVKTAHRAIREWLDTGWLERTAPGRYSLSTEHNDAAVRFLRDFGQRQIDGSKGLPPPRRREKRGGVKKG